MSTESNWQPHKDGKSITFSCYSISLILNGSPEAINIFWTKPSPTFSSGQQRHAWHPLDHWPCILSKMKGQLVSTLKIRHICSIFHPLLRAYDIYSQEKRSHSTHNHSVVSADVFSANKVEGLNLLIFALYSKTQYGCVCVSKLLSYWGSSSEGFELGFFCGLVSLSLSSWTSWNPSLMWQGFLHIVKTHLFFSPYSSWPVTILCCYVPAVLAFLCNRYQTPECDGAARSRISDTEDPFQGRDLTGFLHFILCTVQSTFSFWFWMKTKCACFSRCMKT